MVATAIEKIEMDVPIKATPKQLYEVFCNKSHYVSNVCPDKIKSIDLNEGNWGTEGSIQSWTYAFDSTLNFKKVSEFSPQSVEMSAIRFLIGSSP
ncbi:hypothetical protein TSUD_355060 [Trifolium subterraneum]|uniref:Bet v I/Major latex protein domain-containing protein n=1 Tax=Trifolium subterraneum TaxID=3900 RepID=A0A2Z6N3W4_TRISU|nr:hypothetical protein TSUD_355060 [Trifolium subterraneum]